MSKAYASSVIPAPAAAVWSVIRDFNALPAWHPAIATSEIEDGRASDQVGAIRSFKLTDGAHIRERLLDLSDVTMTCVYNFETTIFDVKEYLATLRCTPVTDGDACFIEWWATFDCAPRRGRRIRRHVRQRSVPGRLRRPEGTFRTPRLTTDEARAPKSTSHNQPNRPARPAGRMCDMHLSMHNWMRSEPIEVTVERLARFGYGSIEIKGEPDQYDTKAVRKLLADQRSDVLGRRHPDARRAQPVREERTATGGVGGLREERRHDGEGARRHGDHDRPQHGRQDRTRRHARRRVGLVRREPEAGPRARQREPACVMAIEPLNRFETHFV